MRWFRPARGCAGSPPLNRLTSWRERPYRLWPNDVGRSSAGQPANQRPSDSLVPALPTCRSADCAPRRRHGPHTRGSLWRNDPSSDEASSRTACHGCPRPYPLCRARYRGNLSVGAVGHRTVLRFGYGTSRARDPRTRGRTMRPDELERRLRHASTPSVPLPAPSCSTS